MRPAKTVSSTVDDDVLVSATRALDAVNLTLPNRSATVGWRHFAETSTTIRSPRVGGDKTRAGDDGGDEIGLSATGRALGVEDSVGHNHAMASATATVVAPAATHRRTVLLVSDRRTRSSKRRSSLGVTDLPVRSEAHFRTASSIPRSSGPLRSATLNLRRRVQPPPQRRSRPMQARPYGLFSNPQRGGDFLRR